MIVSARYIGLRDQACAPLTTRWAGCRAGLSVVRRNTNRPAAANASRKPATASAHPAQCTPAIVIQSGRHGMSRSSPTPARNVRAYCAGGGIDARIRARRGAIAGSPGRMSGVGRGRNYRKLHPDGIAATTGRSASPKALTGSAPPGRECVQREDRPAIVGPSQVVWSRSAQASPCLGALTRGARETRTACQCMRQRC